MPRADAGGPANRGRWRRRPPVLDVTVEEDERGTSAVVVGDLDWAGGDELKAKVGSLVRPDVRLRLDLRGVSLVDSSGLAALLVLSKQAAEAGGTVVLCDPSPRLLAMLERTSTTRLFSVLADH